MKDRVDTPGSSVIGFGLPEPYIVLCILVPAWPAAHRYLPATGGAEPSSHQFLFIVVSAHAPCPARIHRVVHPYFIYNRRNVLPERHPRRGACTVHALRIQGAGHSAYRPGFCSAGAVRASRALLSPWFRSVINTVQTYGSIVSNPCSIPKPREGFYEAKSVETAGKEGIYTP